MLQRLYVRNIALIDEADIEFNPKLNVLSGETGSGKSVILDSINFVLGSKADKSMIRYGETEAIVKAEFVVDENSPAARALSELDIECDGQIIITRKYTIDGKSSIKINGNSVTVAMLKSITSHLVDVHGQSEHFFLLNEANQLKVLDGLCGQDIEVIKGEIAELLAHKRHLKESLNALGGDEQERERKLDLLSYQIGEIEDAEIKEGEFEDLKTRYNVIVNAEKIINTFNTVKSMFSNDGGCTDMISLAQRQMASVADLNEEYGKIYTRLENLAVEAEDISESITDLVDEISFDEGEAHYVEERIELIKKLQKKYGSDEQSILLFLDNAREEYGKLMNCSETIEKLNKELTDLNGKIYARCVKLTEIRKKVALILCKNVEQQLKTLNIANARFNIDFNVYDFNTANLDSTNGSDSVCFMFTANKGEPLKSLNKVISGGEMSRFMLAVKTQLKGLNGISTYIFDEIDAGISGYTAKTVADKFIEIGSKTQIIAVSHLPQVCAASDMQFLIYKDERNGKTVTHVKPLTEDEKIEEIVRLTGSINSPAAREHAAELIKQFK